MKRIAFLSAVLALAAPLAFSQASTWTTDKAHSSVDFAILHMGLSKVRGHFSNVDGTLVFNQADISKSTVKATIDITTLDTANTARDNHLKTDSFFDAAKFPTATFESTSVTKTAQGLSVAGNLTLHGVTKPVTLVVEGPTGPVQGMDHKPHAGFSASTTISRTAFGIGSSFPAAVVGDDVTLTIDLDVVKQ